MPKSASEGFLIGTLGFTDVRDVEGAHCTELANRSEVPLSYFRGLRRAVARERHAIEHGELDLLVAHDAPDTVNLSNEGPLTTRIMDQWHPGTEEPLEAVSVVFSSELPIEQRNAQTLGGELAKVMNRQVTLRGAAVAEYDCWVSSGKHEPVHVEHVVRVGSRNTSEIDCRRSFAFRREHALSEFFEKSYPVHFTTIGSSALLKVARFLPPHPDARQIEVADHQHTVDGMSPGEVTLNAKFTEKLVALAANPVYLENRTRFGRVEAVVILAKHHELPSTRS